MTDENETKRIFAENLRKLLDIKGVTQKDFADALRMNRQTINSWVRGVSFPTSEKLDIIAAYFNTTREALIGFLETDHRMPAHLMAYIERLNTAGLLKLSERAEELLEIERYKRK